MRRKAGDVLPVQDNAAALRRIESCDGIGQGRFAAPVRADQPENLAPIDLQIDSVQRNDPAEASFYRLTM
jgi:hypothetical protein